MARDLELALRVRTDLNRATREIRGLRRDLARTGQTSARAARQTRSLASAWERGATGMAGARRQLVGLRTVIAGLGVALLARSFIQAASTAEQYAVRLRVLLRSQEEANLLFRDAAEFAGRVPFRYEEIMESATQLAGVLRGGRSVPRAGHSRHARLPGRGQLLGGPDPRAIASGVAEDRFTVPRRHRRARRHLGWVDVDVRRSLVPVPHPGGG